MQAAVAIKHDRAPRLAAVESAYYVGKRRPLAELPRWKQWLIRFAYFRTGWASDHSIECLGIFTDREQAILAASIPGGFYHALPVNASLPEENCRFREHAFPASEAAQSYVEASPGVEVVERQQVEKVHRLASRMRERLTTAS